LLVSFSESTQNQVMANLLINCECSGRVRAAFRRAGHSAYSCDLIPAEDGSRFHIIGDALDVARSQHWDGMVAFPPCTFLCVSGARWLYTEPGRWEKREEALDFVAELLSLPIERIALENPVGAISTCIRPASQYIQPWMFGDGETKKTGLWLKNLPKLKPTNIVAGRSDRIHRMAPGPERQRERSRTYQGIADAMAIQWSPLFPDRAWRPLDA
jgi:hypothetical protein